MPASGKALIELADAAGAAIESARWYAVNTQPRAEHKACFHLQRQGFHTYLPRYLKCRRHARRVDTVAAPFFPRYLFVAIDMAAQRWRSINSTVGVSHIVCTGDNPARVPDEIIAQLKQTEDERGFIEVRKPRFSRGDKVTVLDGAFTDCIGIFEAETDEKRVAVLLELLGRKVRVSMEADLIQAS
jgi:transcriptional antiterminator RfaH